MISVQAGGKTYQWNDRERVLVLGVWGDTRWHFRGVEADSIKSGNWIMIGARSSNGDPQLIQAEKVSRFDRIGGFNQ